MVSLSNLEINSKEIEYRITEFIRKSVENAGLNGAIVAVSGGIDSAVTLVLSVKALGPKRVTALFLPERNVTPQCDINDIILLESQLNLTCDVLDITPILHVIWPLLPQVTNRIDLGNVKSITYTVENIVCSLIYFDFLRLSKKFT